MNLSREEELDLNPITGIFKITFETLTEGSEGPSLNETTDLCKSGESSYSLTSRDYLLSFLSILLKLIDPLAVAGYIKLLELDI